MSGVISVSLSTINSPVVGFTMSWSAYLPISLSCSFSIIWFPSFMSVISIPSVVPQSCSLTIISWATSTNLLVKYPESAVLKAVSAKPFLAPCEEIKYSRTSSPSLKQDLIGISTALPDVLAISPRIPAIWRNWFMLPLAPDWAIMYIGFNSSKLSFIASVTSFVAFSHILIIDEYLSSSVIKPRLYCFHTSSTCFSLSDNIFFLASGTATSCTDTVNAPFVAYLYPNALI